MTMPSELARIGLVLDATEVVREGQRATRSFDDIGAAAGRSVGALNRAQGALDTFLFQMRRFAMIAGVGLGVGQVIQYAESWKIAEARLKFVTRTSDELAMVQGQLFAQAQRAGQAFSAQAQLYTRIAQATKSAGYETKQLLDTTDGLAAVLRLSNLSSDQAAGALFQLSQGLSAGALRGDEFNAVAEQMPMLLDIVAKELGRNRDEMRLLASQGKITADVIINAFSKQNAELQKQAAQMPQTIGQAFTKLSNVIVRYVGEVDKATNATGRIAKAINLVADNLDVIIPTLITFGGLLLLNNLVSLPAKLLGAAGAASTLFTGLRGGLVVLTRIPAALGMVGAAVSIMTGVFVAAIPVMATFAATVAAAALPAIALAAPLAAIGYALYKMYTESRKATVDTEKETAARQRAAAAAKAEAVAKQELVVATQRAARQSALAAVLEDDAVAAQQQMRIQAAIRSGSTRAVDATRAAIAREEQIRQAAESNWDAFVKRTEQNNQRAAAQLKKYADVQKAAAAGVREAQDIISIATANVNRELANERSAAALERAVERSRAVREKARESLTAEADAIIAARDRLGQLQTDAADQYTALRGTAAERERARLARERREFQAMIDELTEGIANTAERDAIVRRYTAIAQQQRRNTEIAKEQDVAQRQLLRTLDEQAQLYQKLQQLENDEQRRQAEFAVERERQLRQPLENALRNLQGTISSTFDQFFAGQLKSARDFGQAMVDIARRTAAEMSAAFLMRGITRFAEQAMNSLFPVSVVSTVSELDVPSRLTPIVTPVRHRGGLVDGGGMQRYIDPRLFSGAVRTSQLQLRDDEVPIIAQRGETVLPAGAAPMGGSAGPTINVTMPMTVQALDATNLNETLERASPKIQEIVLRGVSQSALYARGLRGR